MSDQFVIKTSDSSKSEMSKWKLERLDFISLVVVLVWTAYIIYGNNSDLFRDFGLKRSFHGFYLGVGLVALINGFIRLLSRKPQSRATISLSLIFGLIFFNIGLSGIPWIFYPSIIVIIYLVWFAFSGRD